MRLNGWGKGLVVVIERVGDGLDGNWVCLLKTHCKEARNLRAADGLKIFFPIYGLNTFFLTLYCLKSTLEKKWIQNLFWFPKYSPE